MRKLLGTLLLALALVACDHTVLGTGMLKPLPTQTPSGVSLPLQPAEPGFAELNAAPERFQNRLLRVSGAFRKLPPPECVPSRGPATSWALVADGLQLDALGLADVLRLVPGGTLVTVDGVWRRYVGPLGCGKEPPDGQRWYLEALRIVAPNPLPGFGPLEATPLPSSGLLGPPPSLPTATLAPGTTVSPTLPFDVGATTSPTPSATPSLTTSTATPSPFPSVSPTPTRPPTRTPSVSSTPGPSPTPSTTPTWTVTPSPAGTSPGGGFATATPGPPAPTFTPGTPYPAPTPLPTFPNPYP